MTIQNQQQKQGKKQEFHPLASRHYYRIRRRDAATAKQMETVWGLTFLNKGKLIVPVGTVPAMVQDSRSATQIDLLGITADLDPVNMTATWANKRMHHNWYLVPRPAAHGRRLDPRDRGERGLQPGDCPAGEWMRYALDVDKLREKVCGMSYRLHTVPQLPDVYVGYAQVADAAFEPTAPTDAMVEAFCRLQQQSIEQLQAMSEEDLSRTMRAFWPMLFVPPGGDNQTGLYLLPLQYASGIRGVVRVFEDYSKLVGFNTFNPAKLLGSMEGQSNEGKIELVRQKLAASQPHLLPCVTEDDLLRAAETPNELLHVANAAATQCLYRAMTLPHDEAMTFSSADLGGNRAAHFYAADAPRQQPPAQAVEDVQIVDTADEAAA